MDSYNILASRLRYIVPFEIDFGNDGNGKTFEQVCKIIDDYTDYPYSFLGKQKTDISGKWVREKLTNGEQDLYGYIIDEFAVTEEIDPKEDIEKAGCFWHYQGFGKTPFSFEYTNGTDYENSTIIWKLSIVDMGLYIFRSGVGFIWYEVKPDKKQIKTSTELIHFQNKFKELDRGKNNHLWVRKELMPIDMECQSDMIPFMMGNWIAERLQFLNVRYQASRKNSYPTLLSAYISTHSGQQEDEKKLFDDLSAQCLMQCPDKALLFSYVVFEHDDSWKKNFNSLQTVYYLTNGYKESYEMSEDIVDTVRNPFSNVYWSASREGCGYFAWTSKEESNHNYRFFCKNQYSKIMNDYFLLYIRAIYQSYSLMRYAVYTSEILPNDYRKYLSVSKDTEKITEKISSIEAEISLFLVKSMVTSVSHIHHQNEFYGYLIDRLAVKEDVESVTAGLAALTALQHESLVEKQQAERDQDEKREKEVDNTFQIGLGLMTFLTGISAVTDAYGIVSSLANDRLSAGWMIVFLILLGICVLIVMASLIIFVRSVKNLRHSEKNNEKLL